MTPGNPGGELDTQKEKKEESQVSDGRVTYGFVSEEGGERKRVDRVNPAVAPRPINKSGGLPAG